MHISSQDFPNVVNLRKLHSYWGSISRTCIGGKGPGNAGRDEAKRDYSRSAKHLGLTIDNGTPLCSLDYGVIPLI